MHKWLERIAIALIAAFAAIALLGLYVQWSDCKDAGGLPVRGVFGLECIAR